MSCLTLEEGINLIVHIRKEEKQNYDDKMEYKFIIKLSSDNSRRELLNQMKSIYKNPLNGELLNQQSFQQTVLEQLDIHMAKDVTFPLHCTEIKLNITSYGSQTDVQIKMINLLNENIGENVRNMQVGKDFYNRTWKHKLQKKKIINLSSSKCKSSDS